MLELKVLVLKLTAVNRLAPCLFVFDQNLKMLMGHARTGTPSGRDESRIGQETRGKTTDKGAGEEPRETSKVEFQAKSWRRAGDNGIGLRRKEVKELEKVEATPKIREGESRNTFSSTEINNKVLKCDFSREHTCAIVPLKVAALEHKLRDDAVEAAALVPVPLLVCAQPYKVGRRHGHNIIPDLWVHRDRWVLGWSVA